MKKAIIMIAVLALVTVGMTTAAMAQPLPAGGSIVPVGAGLTAGSVWVTDTGTQNFTNAHYSGSVLQEVYTNPTGLLFAYYLTINTSITPVVRMNTTDFAGWTTWAEATGAGEFPNFINRDLSGTVIGFEFADLTLSPKDFGIAGPNTSSATMWVQTDAEYFTQGQITLQNGSVETLAGFQPTIPEPGSAMLLGIGLLGFAGKLRKRFFA